MLTLSRHACAYTFLMTSHSWPSVPYNSILCTNDYCSACKLYRFTRTDHDPRLFSSRVAIYSNIDTRL